MTKNVFALQIGDTYVNELFSGDVEFVFKEHRIYPVTFQIPAMDRRRLAAALLGLSTEELDMRLIKRLEK
jgi:hypothetical protein